MELAPDVEAKLADPELIQLARFASDQVVSVIVELELPRRQVTIETGRPGDRHRVSITDATEGPSPEEALSRVGTDLRDLSGRPVVELASARSDVAQLDGRQLVATAEMPDVRIIRPNRRLTSRHEPK